MVMGLQDATLAALGMMLKCADVMHMTQPFHKHQQWVELLTEEFFQQGDRELALGMQPMPFMNRSKPQCVPSSQVLNQMSCQIAAAELPLPTTFGLNACLQ